MGGHTLYLVGGAPRVGKSSLAQRLLETDGIPWLPTDVLRTVLRRVLPELDAVDQDPVDAWRLAEFMYPHIEQAAEVCAEEAECFLIEGFELSPSYPLRLRTALGEAAAWIRRWSRQLREECGAAGVPYVDVGELGFEAAMRQARRLLLGRG